MLLYELTRLDEGLLFCLFDTPDRVQHMFWRFREADHPANFGRPPADFQHVVEEQYRRCDATLAKVLEQADEQTLVIALSDHGFGTFRRGVNLNAWLEQQGLLVRRRDADPGNGENTRENGNASHADNRFFHDVVWTRTRAYALGIGGIYLNRTGRERQGLVSDDEAAALSQSIARELRKIRDPQNNIDAVRSVVPREEVYHGPHTGQAPDLLVNFAAGYRASWDTALGGVGGELFEDNTRPWSGDHIVDPALVPGVLLMNRPYRADGARLLDMTPTILAALGADNEHDKLEGEALLR
jgi:predicted AlkP superfamily phosphohydrolase/phosphomutase